MKFLWWLLMIVSFVLIVCSWILFPYDQDPFVKYAIWAMLGSALACIIYADKWMREERRHNG